MKFIFICLLTVFSFSSYAQARLTDAELEAKARYAIRATFDAAVVEGNAWHQQIFDPSTLSPQARITLDPANFEVTVGIQNESQLCLISVVVDLDQGYITNPVQFECAEIAVPQVL